MSVTVDCGEGKHDLCSGRGHTAYLFPQESLALSEPAFYCGCPCHHDGRGTPCKDPDCSKVRAAALAEALGADVVIPLAEPGRALSISESLSLRGWFDKRRRGFDA